MEQNIETLKYELRYVWDGEKLLVTSKYMWDHELFTSKSAMFTNCNEHNEVHYVAVKHGFWPFANSNDKILLLPNHIHNEKALDRV